MHLRNAVEDAIRRWDALERSRGEAPVIDFDCAPPADKPHPFQNRFTVLDALNRLGNDTKEQHPALRAQLDAHIAYLRAVIGEQIPFDQYIFMTQGCAARGWTRDYVEHRAQMAKDALGSLGVLWDNDTWINTCNLSEQLPAADVASAIGEYADRYEPTIRQLVDTNATFNLTIEDVQVDAYWSYWLDGAGHDARLRINKRNASFSRVDAYRFALHELLGHAHQ